MVPSPWLVLRNDRYVTHPGLVPVDAQAVRRAVSMKVGGGRSRPDHPGLPASALGRGQHAARTADGSEP